MFRFAVALLSSLLAPGILWAQSPQAPQQSARQALVETLFSGSPSGFVKHLPEATKAALQSSGLAGFGAGPDFASGLRAGGRNFQTFEAGPILISSEDVKAGDKIEIHLDRDDLMGDQDEMDLSFHTFRNGQEQSVDTFFPRVALKMGLEANVWKLRDVALSLRLPLDDPDFLKALKEAFQQRASVNAEMLSFQNLQMLAYAERRYRTAHPDRGYTCSLSELASMKFGSSANATGVVDSQLASGSKDDYKYAISGCGSAPVSSFQITAVPDQPGKRAYCTDESGNTRYSEDGQGATCLSSGTAMGRGTTVLNQ
jgi:hypothetical protein